MVVVVLKQRAIDGVEAQLLLPSCAFLPSPSLHKQGVTDGAKAPSSSCVNKGRPTMPRRRVIIATVGGN
jgi:hypothetical protein